MSKKHQKMKFLIAAIVIAVSALILYMARPDYTLTDVKVSPITNAVYALGTVKSDSTYNLKLGMLTVITKSHVSEGDYVYEGSPLITTDTGIVIKSPIKGNVTDVLFNEKEIAPPNQTVLTIIDFSKMHVRISLDQNTILSVKKGQKAELSFENLRGEKINAVVDAVYPSGGEFLVKIIPEKMPQSILPEMSCDAAIEIIKKDNAILVPAVSIKNNRVNVLRKGNKLTVDVKTGAVNGKWVEILDNKILPDDKIVIQNGQGKNSKKSSNDGPP